MSKQTHTNPLSKREVEALRGNPYIASATTKTVRFTEEFKRMAYEWNAIGSCLPNIRNSSIIAVKSRDGSINVRSKAVFTRLYDKFSFDVRRGPKPGVIS